MNRKVQILPAVIIGVILAAFMLCLVPADVSAADKASKGTRRIKASVEYRNLSVGDKAKIKVTLNKKQRKPLRISLKSTNPKVVKVKKSTTVKEGKKSVSIKIDAKSEGTAVITASFKTHKGKVKKTKIKVTVKRSNEKEGSKILVVFYSYSKNTSVVAKKIADMTGADLYELKTKKAYPDDPYKTSDISIKERDSGKLPDLAGKLPDLSGYDRIFIGGPIWNGYVSTPLEKYLMESDFTGKIIIPFCTSMGSGKSSYLKDFKKRANNPKKVGELLNITYPGNGEPDAFSDKELYEKLKKWVSKYADIVPL